MRTAAQRIAHYEARMVSSLIDPVLAATYANAAANFSAYAIDFVAKQDLAWAVMDADGILGPIRFRYSAYFHELYGLSLRHNGPALDAMAQVIHDKWVSLGCLTATLISMAAVLGITVT